jgi:hypothetical protein
MLALIVLAVATNSVIYESFVVLFVLFCVLTIFHCTLLVVLVVLLPIPEVLANIAFLFYYPKITLLSGLIDQMDWQYFRAFGY